MKKLLVLTSGGDAPGMNASIRACVRTAIHNQVEVYGCESGFEGLLQQKFRPLTSSSVANCIQRGGTILKTARSDEFFDAEKRRACAKSLAEQGFDSLIVLGGDGSFAGAALLDEEYGPNVIGIPCTIDNDINGTEYTIGFDTARNTALSAIDKIRDTAFSHDHNFIIEVMGRSSGFLAVDVGIAGGAEIIIIPEFPITVDQLVEKIAKQRRQKLASIIVVAEANQPGHSIQIAEEIQRQTGLAYRACILGHTQRGGTPTLLDRKIGSIMGSYAVEALLRGEKNKMLAVSQGDIVLANLPEAGHGRRHFHDQELLRVNNVMCEI